MSRDMVEARYFTAPEDGRPTRVAVYLDDTPRESPRREYDHFTHLITVDRDYLSPDEAADVPALAGAIDEWRFGDRIKVDRVARYAAMFGSGEILFVGGLSRQYDGTLSLTARPEYLAGGEYDGVAVVTQTGWEQAMGGGYRGPVTPQELVEQELAEYNAWASGEVYGYTVVQAQDDSDDIDAGQELGSCWGFVGEPQQAMVAGVYELLGTDLDGDATGWQARYELTEAAFDEALREWNRQHGHAPTGTGWPR